MKTTTIVYCAARAWNEVMRFRGQLTDDKYLNPAPGHFIDTAFIARFFGEFVTQLTKEGL